MDEILRSIMPEGYEYAVLHFEKLDKLSPTSLRATVRINVFTPTNVEKWLSNFQDKSFTNIRVLYTAPANGEKVLFKKTYRCHQNTRASYRSYKHKTAHEKNTDCPATLAVTLKNLQMRRSKDIYLKTMPLEVKINHTHNHPLMCANVLRHRRMEKDLKEKFVKMFRNGHSPSSALNIHKFDLQEEKGDKYYEAVVDGSLCPNLQSVYHLYHSIFKKEYRTTETELVNDLNSFVNEYNKKCNSIAAVYQMTTLGPLVAICTPLVKQVHKTLTSSAEIMFVDSFGPMGRCRARVFLFLTPTLAGALPLGIVLTYSDCKEIIHTAFNFWKGILPKKSFYGQQHPNIIITDDHINERNALKETFPKSNLLLCKSHILQAFWSFLWKAGTGVSKKDRPEIFHMFEGIVDAVDEIQMGELYATALSNPLVNKYSHVRMHLEKIKQRVTEWSLCFRGDLSICGNDTNNYAEATFRILKGIVLGLTKSCNTVQLLDFLVTRLESYFTRRVIDLSNGRVQSYQSTRYYVNDVNLKNLECHKVSHDLYEVYNKDKNITQEVNINLNICSCVVGIHGVPCKHQYVVSKNTQINSEPVIPLLDHETKRKFMKLLRPNTTHCQEWFLNLKTADAYAPSEVDDSGMEDEPHHCNTMTGQEWVLDFENVHSYTPNKMDDNSIDYTVATNAATKTQKDEQYIQSDDNTTNSNEWLLNLKTVHSYSPSQIDSSSMADESSTLLAFNTEDDQQCTAFATDTFNSQKWFFNFKTVSNETDSTMGEPSTNATIITEDDQQGRASNVNKMDRRQWFLSLKTVQCYSPIELNGGSVEDNPSTSAKMEIVVPMLERNVEHDSESNNVQQQFTVSEINCCKQKLHKVFNELVKHVDDNPGLYIKACTEFTDNFLKLKTQASVISNLRAYGKQDILSRRQPTAMSKTKS